MKSVSLTNQQWADILSALNKEAEQTKKKAQTYRERLLRTRKEIVAVTGEPCGWCGALTGTHEGWDGNQRCDECQGC